MNNKQLTLVGVINSAVIQSNALRNINRSKVAVIIHGGVLTCSTLTGHQTSHSPKPMMMNFISYAAEFKGMTNLMQFDEGSLLCSHTMLQRNFECNAIPA